MNTAKTIKLITLILNSVKIAHQAIHFSMDITVIYAQEKPIGTRLQRNVKVVSKEQYSITFKTSVIVKMKAHSKSMMPYVLNVLLQNILTLNSNNAKIAKKENNSTQQLNFVYALPQSLSKAKNLASLASCLNTLTMKIKFVKTVLRIIFIIPISNLVLDAQQINLCLLMIDADPALQISTSIFQLKAANNAVEVEIILARKMLANAHLINHSLPM